MRNRTAGVAGMLIFVFGLVAAPLALAGDSPAVKIAIKDGAFEPARITIPAGKQVKLLVSNDTAPPAEIESYDFTMEKVIPGHTRIPVYVGPLKAGSYNFFNDFAQGVTGTLIVE